MDELKKHMEQDERNFKKIGEQLKTANLHTKNLLDHLSADVGWIQFFMGAVILTLLYIVFGK